MEEFNDKEWTQIGDAEVWYHAFESWEDGSKATYILMRGHFGKKEIIPLLEEAGFYTEATHCQHAHDCCGHWYSSGARIRWIQAPEKFENNEALVTIGSYQNI